jgi:hypothetical protein
MCDSHIIPDEHSALLPSHESSDAKYKSSQKHIFTLFSFLLITAGSTFLQLAPMTAIMESIICENHYQQASRMSRNHSQAWSDSSCKIEPVQSELAKIRGWQQLFDCLACTYQPHIASRSSHLTEYILFFP